MSGRKQKHHSDPSNGGLLPVPPSNWTRCHFFLTRKNRFCRQNKNDGSDFCGNHQGLEASSEHKKTGSTRKRIPCPIDSSHTIYEDMVARHLKICPKIKRQRIQHSQPHFQENINAGGHGLLSKECKGMDTRLSKLDRAKLLALRVLEVHQQLFGGENLKIKDARHLTLHDIESALPLRDLSKAELQAGLQQAIESYHIRCGGPKHLQQQASLLGHMRQLTRGCKETTTISTTNENDDCNSVNQDLLVLELGAGRGMLGLISASALVEPNPRETNTEEGTAAGTDPTKYRNVDLVMIERSGTRSKADTILRNHTSGLAARCLHVENIRNWQRIECDLAHIDMLKVLKLQEEDPGNAPDENQTCTIGIEGAPSQVQEPKMAQPKQDILVVAKHLCGAGTDFALKALYPIRDRITGCIMATCCHGLCTWSTYVGRDYLRALIIQEDDKSMHANLSTFGSEEFDLLRLWSSGTVKVESSKMMEPSNDAKHDNVEGGNDNNNQEEQHNSSEDVTEQRVISVSAVVKALNLPCGSNGLGRAVQRILDYGRKRYLETVLLPSEDVLGGEKSKIDNSSTDLC